jgi:hypothetical protein
MASFAGQRHVASLPGQIITCWLAQLFARTTRAKRGTKLVLVRINPLRVNVGLVDVAFGLLQRCMYLTRVGPFHRLCDMA